MESIERSNQYIAHCPKLTILARYKVEIVYNKNMKVYNYRWILIFFMLWLPLQGAAGAVLSVCMQEKSFNGQFDRVEISIDSHHHDDCHKQTANNAIGHLLESLPCDDMSCDAYGNTSMVSDYTVPMPIDGTSGVFTLKSDFISFVPEQPQHPPLIASL
jgi:hypothetical protein